MNRSNNSQQIKILTQKILAYETDRTKATQQRDELQDRLDKSREDTRLRRKKDLAEQQEKLRLLENYPVATYPGEDRKRRQGAKFRSLSSLEEQLYRKSNKIGRLVLLFICFLGLVCIPVRQTGITIICIVIVIVWLLIIRRQNKRFRRSKKDLRNLVIRQWTQERDLTETTILRLQNEFGKDLSEERIMSQHIQDLDRHLRHVELQYGLACADLQAFKV